MKSLTFTRGVGLAGALTITHAAIAFAATGQAATTHARHVEPAAVQAQGTGPRERHRREHAVERQRDTATTHVAATSGGGASIVRTIVGLFIVIAVIYGIAWIMKQAKRSKSRPSGHGLSQVANLPLGSGRSVAVVRAGREMLVVGVAENGVTPIRSYTEAEAIALGIDVPTEGPRTPTSVEKPLGRALKACAG